MSDDGLSAQSKGDSMRDMELGDQAILVRTECLTESQEVSPKDVYEMRTMQVNGWRQRQD